MLDSGMFPWESPVLPKYGAFAFCQVLICPQVSSPKTSCKVVSHKVDTTCALHQTA